MQFEKLKSFEGLQSQRRLKEEWRYTAALLLASEKHNTISKESMDFINAAVKVFNSKKHTVRSALKDLGELQHAILRQLRLKDSILLPNYFRNYWMIVGALLIGLPLALVIHLLFDQMILIGPAIGALMGYFLGTQKDKVYGKTNGHLLVEEALKEF